MKKIIIFVLALALCMALAVVPAFAATVDAEYLDANGSKQTAADVTEITGGCEKGAGWYILSGSLSLGKLTFTGDTHLILADGADITVSGGILLNGENASLTIYGQSAGTGKLTVKDVPDDHAGIGSYNKGNCGDITVNGGTIAVTGTNFGAAIGSGFRGNCGNITINGGVVTAIGGNYGATIGSGNYNRDPGVSGTCGNITITGGKVTATGGKYGAGIGSSNEGRCGTIKITGGTVTATGGLFSPGIGSGDTGNCGDITISGGYIKAKSDSVQKIGHGRHSSNVNVTYVSCERKDGKDGWYYVNYEPYAAKEPTCLKGGSKECFHDLRDGKYYEPLSDGKVTLIGNENALALWLAEGGNGYIAPLGHYDNNGDSFCDCCSIQIFEIIAAVQPTCTETGSAAYIANCIDGLYYTESSFTEGTLIGDENDLAAWLAEGGNGCIAPLGHCDNNGDSFCDRCGGHCYYDYDTSLKQMLLKAVLLEDISVIDTSADTLELTDGWYIVKDNVEIENGIAVNGDVHLIIADGSALAVKKGILLAEGKTLAIYSQSFGSSMGTITVSDVADNCAGIGSGPDNDCEGVTINGCNITVTGGMGGAAIGSGAGTDCKNVTINGGTVIVNDGKGGSGALKAGKGGAGIGSGVGGNCICVTINGGYVEARGGKQLDGDPNGGAGIGGGFCGNGGDIYVNGGTVRVYGYNNKTPSFGKPINEMGSAAVLHVGEGVNAYTLNAVGEKDAKLTADASGIVETYTYYRIIIDSETSNTNGSTASVLSEGSLTIVVGVAAAVVFGLGGFLIGRKKKPAQSNS